MNPRIASYFLVVFVCATTCWWYGALYSANVGNELKPGIVDDLYPVWNAARAIINGADPYSEEVAVENEVAAYGASAKAVGSNVRQWFAYPIFAAFPLLPFSVFSFRFTSVVMLVVMAALALLSVWWLRGKWNLRTVLYSMAFFSFYPLVYSIQARQPTLLFFALACADLYLLRRGKTVDTGLLSALALAKPQVGLPIVLPMVVWSLARRNLGRGRFVVRLGIFLSCLCGMGLLADSHWIVEWLGAAKAYAGYIRPSLLVSIFGHRFGVAISVVVFSGLCWLLWARRRADLISQCSISIIVFLFVAPYQVYNTVMLIVPVIWVLDNSFPGGVANEVARTAVNISLGVVCLGNATGVALWYLFPNAAWLVPGATTQILLWSLAAFAGVQVAQFFRTDSSSWIWRAFTHGAYDR